jgi:hypothetical protein
MKARSASVVLPLLFLSIAPGSVLAQSTIDALLPWSANGTRVCGAVEDQYAPALANAGGGNSVHAWVDRRSGAIGIYGQRMGRDGFPYPGWPTDGTACGTGVEGSLVIANDGLGGAFISFDNFSEYGRFSTYHLKTLAWDFGGSGAAPAVEIAAPIENPVPEKPHQVYFGYHDPMLAPEHEGSVLVAWMKNEYREFTALYSYYLMISRFVRPGSDAPPTTLVAGWNAPIRSPALCHDDRGIFLAWVRAAAEKDIVVKRIGPDLAADERWPWGGVVVCAASGDQEAPGIASDGAGGAFVVWQDRRDPNHERTYAQHVLEDGSIAAGWPADGLALSTDASVAASTRTEYPSPVPVSVVIADGRGGALVAWIGLSETGSAVQVRAQRLVAEGVAAGWSEGGVVVGAGVGDQRRPAMATDGAGGAYFVWQDRRNGVDWDIEAQHLDGSGRASAPWPSAGASICAAIGDQSAPAIESDAEGGAFVTWTDARDGSTDIYSARLAPDRSTPVLVSLVSATASPGEARVVWNLSETAAALRVERRTDRGPWMPLRAVTADGMGRVELVDREVQPGARYGYRLVVTESGRETPATEAWITVPADAFALEGVRPNPATRASAVFLSLPDARPARLEILDVGGRRVLEKDLSGAGRHQVNLANASFPPGVYLVRLASGELSASARMVFVAP